jgi:hypothetical protein
MFDPNNPTPQDGMMHTMGAPVRNGGFGPPQAPGAPPIPQPGGANFVAPKPGFGGFQNQGHMGGILQALQGFRDARQAWREGGRVGPRPFGRDFINPAQPGQPNPAVGALGGAQPQGPATSGMYGTSMGVIGATPALNGFDLPDY